MKIEAVALIVRTAQELGRDDGPHLAAGVAYYTFLSLFPLLLGVLALSGFFIDADTMRGWLQEFFTENLPTSTDLLDQNINDIQRYGGVAGIISVVSLFWTASAMFGAISRAVNRAWDVRHDRPFYIAKVQQLTMALGVGLLFGLSAMLTTSTILFDRLESPLKDKAPFLASIGFSLITSVSSMLIALLVFLLIYKYLPNTRTYWRYIWPGALLAAALFEAAKTVFVIYLNNFANYQVVYGSLASIIVLLVWLYFSALILILGAEFASEYTRMRLGTAQGELAER